MKKIVLPILLTLLFVACKKDENKTEEAPKAGNAKEVSNLDVNSDWVYFSFANGGVVTETAAWDIAFKGYSVKTKIGAVQTEKKAFDEVAQAPADGYENNEERYVFSGRNIAKETVSPVIYTSFHTSFWTAMEGFGLFKSLGLTDAQQGVMKANFVNDKGFQTFSYNGFKFTQNNWVYVVKAADEKFAKIQFTGYTNDKNKSGFISFKYQLSDSNGKF